MAADGQITLGLDISQSTAQISADLDAILKSAGGKKIIVDIATEKAQVRKDIQSLINEVNSQKATLGIQINASDINKAISQQQKLTASIKSAQEYVATLEKSYSNLGNSKAAQSLQTAINNLKSSINNDGNLTLDEQWTSISNAILKAKEAVSAYKNELSAVQKQSAALDKIIVGSDSMAGYKLISESTEQSVIDLKNKLTDLSEQARKLKTDLQSVDFSDSKQVEDFQRKLKELQTEYQNLSKEAKTFESSTNFDKFQTKVENLRRRVEEFASTYSSIKTNPQLSQELDKIREKLKSINTESDLSSVQKDFANLTSEVEKAGLKTQTFGDKLKSVFQNFSYFFSASHLIYQVVDSFKQMIQNVISLNSAMVELRKVTEATDADFDTFLTNAKSKAVELGSTVTDLVNATADFSRLGYSLDEAEELGRVATIYSNVGDDVDSIDQATTSLISTMKGFGLEASDAMSIIDKFNEVGNKFAISSGGIGDALQRSAAALAAANNTIDESIALIVAANNVIQDPETVGTMWKTVSMRIRGATTELEEAGLETDYMAESTASLRKEIMALTNVDGTGGFDIMADADNFKSTYEIILGIGQVWEKISDIDQAALLELLAGKRQGNALAATLTNLEDLQGALAASQGSAGSALKEQEVWMESLEAKINQFKAAFESLSSTVINDDFLGAIIDTGTNLLSLLDNIIQSVGGIGNALLILSTIIAALNFTKTVSLVQSLFDSLKTGFGIISKVTGYIKNFKNAINLVSIGAAEGGNKITQFANALTGMSGAATIATAAIMGIVAVIAIAIVAYQNWKKEQEEIRQSIIDNANEAKESTQNIQELVDKYSSLTEEFKTNASVKDELEATTLELAEALGIESSVVQSLKSDYDSLTDSIKESAIQKLQSDRIDLAEGVKVAGNDILSVTKNGWLDTDGTLISVGGKNYNYDTMKMLTSKGLLDSSLYGEAGGSISLYRVGDPDTIEGAIAAYEYLKQVLSAITDEYGQQAALEDDTYNKVYNKYSELGEVVESYYEAMDAYNNNLATEFLITETLGNSIPKTQEAVNALQRNIANGLFNSSDWMGDKDNIYDVVNDLLNQQSWSSDFVIKPKVQLEFEDDLIENSNLESSITNSLEKFKDSSGKLDLEKLINVGEIYEESDKKNNRRAVLTEEEQAYVNLKYVMDQYGLSVNQLADYLIELGYANGVVQNSLTASDMVLSDLTAQMKEIDSASEVVSDALADQAENGYLSAESYNSLIALGKEYADCLEWNGQALELNNEKIQELIKSKNLETKASLEEAKALDTQTWIQKVSELAELESRYDTLTDAEKEDLDTLHEQTSALAENIQQYQLLISQLDYATSGYKAWLDAQSQTDSGEIFDDAISAYEALQEGFETGKVGTSAFKGAMDFLIPDDVIDQGLDAVENYIYSIRKLFDDENGFAGIQTFLDKAVGAGLAEYSEDGSSWSLKPGVDTDDLVDGLHMTKDLVLAALGELEEYGFEFDFLDEDPTAALIAIQNLIDAKAELRDIEATSGIDSSEYIEALSNVKELEQEIRNLPEETLAQIGIEVDPETQELLYNGVTIEATTELTVGKNDVQQMIEDYRVKWQELQDAIASGADVTQLESDLSTLRDNLNGLSDATKQAFNIDSTLFDSGIASITETLNDYKTALLELDKAKVSGEGVEEAQQKVDDLRSTIENIPDLEVKTNIDLSTLEEDILSEDFELQMVEVPVSADTSQLLADIAEAEERIQNIQSTPVKIDADTTAAEGKIAILEQKVNSMDGKVVTVNADTSSAEENANKLYVAIDKIKSKTIKITAQVYGQSKLNTLKSTLDSIKSKTVTVTTKYKTESSGAANAGGNEGAKKTEVALGGEVGQELVVDPKSGTWRTIGDHGAEFFQIHKGDIVFNAEQTKELLSTGKVQGRGKAFLNGTAMVTGGGSLRVPTNYENKTGASSTSGKTSSSSTASQIKAAAEATQSLEEQLEETLEEMKDLMDDLIGDYEHRIFLMEKNGVNSSEIIKVYKEMQEAVHQQAEEYRKLGLDENSDYIQDLQKQWWDYEESIRDLIVAGYEDAVKEHENAITLNENWLDNAIAANDRGGITEYTNAIVDHYKAMQEEIHQQAEYYRSLEYSDTSDEVSELSDLWWDYYERIKNVSAEAWQQVVDNANEALDSITDLYDTLKTAAQEYAESGYITVDTLQDICALGVENLAYLSDENGLLVINEENIQKVIAARTQQMAIETALNYVQQLREAVMNNDAVALMNLTTATSAAASSTWDLVYAQLQLLGLDSQQYNNALDRINTLRSLTDITVSGIGKVDGALREAIENQADALEDLLKYVEEMIKQEVENQIEALEDQVDAMKELVDLQKKSLDLEKEKDNYTKTVAEKQKEIAELRQKIYMLDLDDSREAAVEKAKLQEDLSELINDLADYQSDYAYDAASDMLDDMADAYEKEKQTEIDMLESSISSEEKLYQLAIERISNQWDTLYQDLINWNYEYGSVTNDEITSAWDAASAAVREYGSYLNAVLETQKQIAAYESSSSSYGDYDTDSSSALGSAGSYDTSGGAVMSQIKQIVAQMKANSVAHYSADTTGKARLNKANLDLGEQLQSLIGRVVKRGDDGVWYLDRVGGLKLYETYPYSTYHTGGFVGDDPDLEQNELFIKAQKGELVLTEEQQDNLWQIIKKEETMLGKYGELFDSANNTSLIDSQLETQIKHDSQQAQNIVERAGDDYSINVPVQIYPVQKLDDKEIKQLTGKISDYTIGEIKGAFVKRGKKPLGSILKP